MLATPGALPDGPEWVFEVKWDGMRLLADVADGRVRLASRTERDVTASFPELAELTRLAPDVLLDGEVVLLEGGVPSFPALLERLHGPALPRTVAARPVTYMVFDVLRLYGVPLLDRPFEERRATLERLDLASVPALSLSPTYADGHALFEATRERGMEGVVAKRRDGVYRPGRRGPGWTKVTHRQTQVCVVGGWRPERAGPGRIGSLLLGVPDAAGLRFAGRVGSGLAGETTQRVLRDRLVEAEQPPFADRLPRPDGAGAHWCEPQTVVEVAHTGWTEGGRLRQPVFRGVRDDLDPDHVQQEA
ncbi:non-homologous end-joining DNA ligase [Pseudonocardia xinjiangensis]|uniref:non-homologous end-joining DNA ligase n=1 Tax=Pseudonocardia xinjiangensis TaxID=75289 RepID=UPI003D8E0C7B